MEKYIGLDVHVRSTTYAIVNSAGKRLKVGVVATTAKELVEVLVATEGEKHVCFEEGSQSEWLYELLRPHARRSRRILHIPRSVSDSTLYRGHPKAGLFRPFLRTCFCTIRSTCGWVGRLRVSSGAVMRTTGWYTVRPSNRRRLYE
jgi:hypothetical protein